MKDKKISNKFLDEKRIEIASKYSLNREEVDKLIITNNMTIYLYNPKENKINILYKNGKLKDFAKATDQWNVSAWEHPVSKFYVCFPKK